MNPDELQGSQHIKTRSTLRVSGPIVFAIGLGFIVVGFVSFFRSFGSFEPPRYFWCIFIGMPLLALGGAMCRFGYMGMIQRYIASESLPVAKDAINYLGENTRPGVKAMAAAVAEGIREGERTESAPEKPNG